MAFLDKLNSFANAATEKASDVLESGKLNLKINTEERKIEQATLKIGQCLLRSLDAGQEYDESIMNLYEEIQASRTAISSIKADLTNLSGVVFCPSCHAKNPPESKFCRDCGTKLEPGQAADETVEIVDILCPNCGTTVGADLKFCTQCGAKLD